MSYKVQRVAVLYSRLSGYMVSCLKALKEHYGVELLVFRRPPSIDAPFEARQFDWIDDLYNRNEVAQSEMQQIIERFNPQVVFMSGWMDRDYLKITRQLRKQNVIVIAGTDTQWNGSWRQKVGSWVSPWYVHSAIDALWVAGERQRQLAHILGFSGKYCMRGVYACDWDQFAKVFHNSPIEQRQKAFLYVGRYVPVKGIDILVEAYEAYRSMVTEPWSLICAGAGIQEPILLDKEGIINRGFIQPHMLPDLMGEASAFVLPSTKEPWGVVVQEAAAAGLPLICSDAIGATVHLLKDLYNGYLFESGNAMHLALCMKRMAALSQFEWSIMSRHSHTLSEQYTPQIWADTLVQGVDMLQTIDL